MAADPTLTDKIQALAFEVAEGILKRMPWETLQTLGRGVGRLFHAVDARHRRVVRENIRATDLGLSEAEVRALSRDCFAHFGALFLSGIRLFNMPEEELERRVRIRGLEHYDAARATGKGFIVLTGHYGNWEALALALSAKGRHISVIGRALPNPLLDAKLRAYRGRFGNEVILKAGAYRGAIQALRRGKGIGFLLDQDALGMGVFVRFLGRWASTFSSAGLLAVKFDLPVVQLRSWPEPDGTITVSVEPPFRVPLTGDAERDAWTATQMMASRLDAEIRRDPRWWFWMHRRFKTQPGRPGAPALPPADWVEASFPGLLP
ncbi:lysophospholipid acyltransferase family protein [Mesoterricola sediminis]|uniref:Lipid A biosynthesis lauroyl acyltransferase n=1 Tax=Mesoterricola sediminis TaxID=2927980 RepID=A0AA48H318_9BACT|nr:lysophospholipid acyltransferase family protein [Mesoterricola sediminis]BDU76561.1 lipid A biosynthesis lauroyl acyltransferase [Mesoterricola sediminis]